MQFINGVRQSSVLVIVMAFFASLFLTGCPSGGEGSSISGTTLISIAVSPAPVTVARGQTVQFTATGTYYNGSTADITSQVTWSSASTSIATINSDTGLATGVAVGDTTVTATAKGVTSPTASLSVSAAVLTAISITPTSRTVLAGAPVSYSASGTYSDGSTGDATGTVTWNSSDNAVATINASGVASTLAQGSTTISASADGVTSNSANLKVKVLTSIAVNPPTATVAKGLTTHFTATGTYSDASTADISSQVTWATGNSATATIDSSTGVATGVEVGSTSVTASANSVTSPDATLTVTVATLDSIVITPTTPSTPKGSPVTFTATGTFSDASTADISGSVIWSSSDSGVATLNSSGVASSLGQGITTVTASATGTGFVLKTSNSATLTVTAPVLTSITVNPATATVPKWLSTSFTATGTYTDATTTNITTQVVWSTSDPAKATINNSTGVATGVDIGSSTITATLGGKSSTAILTVTPAVLTSISITPKVTSTPKGSPVTFKVTGSYSDSTNADVSGSVTWVSSKEIIATIDSSGIASSLALGTTTLTATVSVPGSGTVTDSATLTVTAPVLTAISINPATATVASGLTTSFTATGTYTDATTANITSQVTWTSTNTGVATIASTGVATGGAVGSANITAAASGITSPAATLSVSNAILSSISVTPATPSVPKGTPVTFTATGIYSNGSSANLSGSVAWASTNTAVATISSSGVATSLATGNTNVTATSGAITSNTAVLTVTAPALVSIAITPTSANVTLGGTKQFSATGTYTDGTTANITNSVTWSSSDLGVSTIDSAGLATTSAAGSTNISASSGSVTSNLAGLVVPLAAPSGLIAKAAPGQVTLTWTAVPGATSYNLYWGNTSGIDAGTTNKITNVSSPYVHTPLTDGSTYFYHVSAVNAASGEEVFSTESFSYLYAGGNPQGSFSNTGFMKHARMGHVSALLSSGKVLVTAGTDIYETFYLADSEVYDPVAGTFSDTGSLGTARGYASSTTLPNGKVLVIGGRTYVGNVVTHLASAELFDPVTGKFTATGSMSAGRAQHTATLLANGKVLVTGGCYLKDCNGKLATAEIYDPVTGIFTATGNMSKVRADHTATLLANGKVLVAGGCITEATAPASANCGNGDNTAELYNPATGTFAATGNLHYPKNSHTATLMTDGKVLVVGGNGTGKLYSDIFDPAGAGTFSSGAPILEDGNYHSAILLSNGKVIVMPCGCGDVPSGAHLYDPGAGTFTVTGTSNGFKHQNSVLMPSGKILLTGGQTAGDVVNPAVITNDAEYFY